MNTETKQATAIEMVPCKSSQIAAIGHDPETNTLAIQFPSKTGTGSVYHYQNFTAEDFAAFSAAESMACRARSFSASLAFGGMSMELM